MRTRNSFKTESRNAPEFVHNNSRRPIKVKTKRELRQMLSMGMLSETQYLQEMVAIGHEREEALQFANPPK